MPFYNELAKTGSSKWGLDTNHTRSNELYFKAHAATYRLSANHVDRGFLPQQLKVRLALLGRTCTFPLNFESRRVGVTATEAKERVQRNVRWYRH